MHTVKWNGRIVKPLTFLSKSKLDEWVNGGREDIAAYSSEWEAIPRVLCSDDFGELHSEY
jgi:hypothetical protein